MTRSQLDLHRFEKVLALLDSAVEGEALAALGRAKHMLAGADISFSELKVGISSSRGSVQEPVQKAGLDTAEVQRLEQELESLRWSLARHELQIAALRQSVEEKSSQIQSEQAKRHAQEGELAGLRKAHAVQMETALNRQEEVEKLGKQLELYKAVEKVTGIGPNATLRQKMVKSKVANSKNGPTTSSSKEDQAKPAVDISPTLSAKKRTAQSRSETAQVSRAPVSNVQPGKATSLSDKTGLKSTNKLNKSLSMVQQGALDLIGGEDRSVGKEYRWARLEEKHQVMGTVPKVDNDDLTLAGANGLNKLEQAMGLQAEA